MQISQPNTSDVGADLDGLARRIVELAEICVSEHLQTIARSQAEGLIKLARQSELRESGNVN